jgi:hypothetical protein
MVINFRIREISWGAHKLARTPTLIKKKIKEVKEIYNSVIDLIRFNKLISFNYIIKKL